MQNHSKILNPKVILFSSRLLPPSETFIQAQGEGLQQFTPYYVGSRIVKGLSLPSERTLVVNKGGFLGAVQEGLFKLLGCAPKLYQAVHQLNPVLVHAHFGLNGVLALPLARTLNLPMVVTFHGSDATEKDEYTKYASLTHRIYFHRREALKREVKLFIAVSDFIKAKLLEQGFPPDKIVVHYIGVDREIFQPELDLPREPIVLFVGRLVEKKGCEYLIQAMAKVQAVMPEVELVIIGDGPLRASLESLAKSLLWRYRFLGVQPPQVVRNWMNRVMVFSVPSVIAQSGDAEGLGIVFAEAQAMGLPVVSFASGGIPEVVVHGDTGFLAAERDWNTLATHILRILQDPILWQRFSLNGQQRVRSLFDLHKQTRVLESIYEAALQKQF
jgi:colanic acid/amylovoran biosynthesis glycosyltransferase